MRTRCKCCNLPENLRNIVDTSITRRIAYREIVASINPMLDGQNKLTINNLSDHKNHIVNDLPDPETGLVIADAKYHQKVKESIKRMTIKQCEVVIQIQKSDDHRVRRQLPGAVEVLRKLWSMGQSYVDETPKTPINYYSIDELLKTPEDSSSAS